MTSAIPVTALTALSVLNLVLLLAVLARVAALTGPGGDGAPDRPPAAGRRAAGPSPLPAPGTKLRDFTALCTDGSQLTWASLRGRTLVGLFATGCPPCAAMKPRFLAAAASFPGGRDQVLAVIVGAKENPAPLAAELAAVARVIVEPARGSVSAAFGIDAYPAACLLAGPVVIAADTDVAALPLPHRLTAAQGSLPPKPAGTPA